MSREKPYHTNQVTYRTILPNRNIIPMNNRNYDWERAQIIKFLKDLFHIFGETNYIEKMGSIIYYTGNPEGKEVWDGQQRLITTYLILNALCFICKLFQDETERGRAISFANGVMHLMKEDLDSMVELSTRILEFQRNPKFAGYTNIPMVHCINPHDNEAIIRIFNDYIPFINNKTIPRVLDDTEILGNDDEETVDDECNCNICLQRFQTDEKFIRHLKKHHQYDDSPIRSKDTKVFAAYEFICSFLYVKLNNNLPRIKEFYQFIINYIDINQVECTDITYASELFDWENNRGKQVPPLDVIKNQIIAAIPEGNRYEIYDLWMNLKNNKNPMYSEYGQKIFICAIQLCVGKITTKCVGEQEALFQNIKQPTPEETHTEVLRFFQIVTRLLDIMNRIMCDRYGRLISNKSCRINWEGYAYLLLPIFFTIGTIDARLIQLVTTWYFRNTTFKVRSFNNLAYSNEFVDIANRVIQDPSYDYYSATLNTLRKNKDAVCSESYVNIHTSKSWKSDAESAKMLLYFMETKSTPDDHFPVLEHDLEHIYPINKQSELTTAELVYYLGNLTILEPKNSQNGQKGNRSIKDGSYDLKKTQYRLSSNKLTRDIVDNYDVFDSSAIKSRTNELVKVLNVMTDY